MVFHKTRVMKSIFVTICTFNMLHAEVTSVYDLGSGSVKLQVVQHEAGSMRSLYSHLAKTFPPSHSLLSEDKTIRFEDQAKILAALVELQQSSLNFKPNHSFAVATELFRQARNGQEVVRYLEDSTGIKIDIISQEQEGILGFLTACHEGQFNPESSVVWDIGSGSFQITCLYNSHYVVYKSQIGLYKAFQLLAQGKHHKLKSALNDIPEAIRTKIADEKSVIVGIGAHPVLKLGKTNYCPQDITEALTKSDLAGNSHLLLVQAVLENLAISKVIYHYSPSGITTGALLYK